MFNSRPDLQIEVEKLTVPLSILPIGETITYASLRDAVGGSYAPWSLIKARRIVENDTGLRLESVHGVGLKKLSATDVAAIGGVARQRIGRIAKRQSGRLTGLKYNDLTADERRKIDVERSLLGAISAVASNSAAKAMEQHAETGPQVAARVFGIVAPADQT